MHPSKLEKGRVYTSRFGESQDLFLGRVNTLEPLGVKKGTNGSASNYVISGTQNHSRAQLWLLGLDAKPFQQGMSFDDVLKLYDDNIDATTFHSLILSLLKIDVDADELPLELDASDILVDIPTNALDAIKDRVISDVFFEPSIIHAINHGAILNMSFEDSVPEVHPSIKQFLP